MKKCGEGIRCEICRGVSVPWIELFISLIGFSALFHQSLFYWLSASPPILQVSILSSILFSLPSQHTQGGLLLCQPGCPRPGGRTEV